MVKHIFMAMILTMAGAGIAAAPAFAQGKFKEEVLDDRPAVDAERTGRPASRANPPPAFETAPPAAPRTETGRTGRLRIETYRNQPPEPPAADEDYTPPPARSVVTAPPPSRRGDYLPPVPTRESAPAVAPPYEIETPRRTDVTAPIREPSVAPPPTRRVEERRAAPLPPYEIETPRRTDLAAPTREPEIAPPPTRRAEERRRVAPPPRSTAFAACTNRCIANCEMEFEQCNGGASPAKSSCVRQLESCRPERCGCRMF